MTKMIIIGIILAFIVYNILNKFIFPIFRITSAASNHMKQMQDQMNEMNKKMNANQNLNNQPPRKVKKDGDYIDYEEIK